MSKDLRTDPCILIGGFLSVPRTDGSGWDGTSLESGPGTSLLPRDFT